MPGYRNCSRWYGSGHKGVDICASAGTPIYASAGGTVTKAGYNKAGAGTGYGYSVIISHSGGYTTVYAHCLSLAVSAGQTVRQGQLIGYVGSTGRSSGNHCHFEIRRNGEARERKHKLGSPIRQQRRPPPVADEGRRCWGSGQQDTSAILCTKWTLGAATRMLA